MHKIFHTVTCINFISANSKRNICIVDVFTSVLFCSDEPLEKQCPFFAKEGLTVNDVKTHISSLKDAAPKPGTPYAGLWRFKFDTSVIIGWGKLTYLYMYHGILSDKLFMHAFYSNCIHNYGILDAVPSPRNKR